MNIVNRKTMAIAVATFLIIAMLFSFVAFPTVKAQKTTFPFIGALPNPVGVGQEVLLHVGITHALANVAQGWEGLTVTVEKPDGTKETLGPFRTDSTGGTGAVYVPSQVGTYYLQTNFPEQTIPSSAEGTPTGTTMLASTSEKLALVVQAEPLTYYPGSPLPTEFWTRPINAQHWSWSAISGSSWMNDEYNQAPGSPHVLWTKPLTIGGLVGGAIGDHSFEHGDAYEGKWGGGFFGGGAPLILAGRLYYQEGAYDRPRMIHCVDLRTGEEYWSKRFLNDQGITFGQTFYWDNFNYHGTFSYLWVSLGGGFFFGGGSSTWVGFHPFTGEWVLNFTSVPSGTRIVGPSGEICLYNVNLNTNRMLLYNSTKAGMRGATSMQAGSWGSRVSLQSINFTQYGLEYDIAIPDGLPGSVQGVNLGDKVVGSYISNERVVVWGFSLKPGQLGTLLFNRTWTAPSKWKTDSMSFTMFGNGWVTTDFDAGIGLIWIKEYAKHYAFSLETGEFLWETEVPQNYLDVYSNGRRFAYGKLYSVGQAGIVYCWDAADGKLLWSYEVDDPYTEFLWGNQWSEDIMAINDGRLYLFHSEHSPVNPLFRGAPAVCLDAETGEVIWRVDGLFRKTDWGGQPIMGDSVIAMYNSYDQQVYAIGKGPSATTVETGPKSLVLGEELIISGTVLDVSPGTKQTGIALRFPNGVPAVADESMGDWMKYVYAQFEHPADAVGVEVTIDVLDSNGNYRNIGTTTTDASGGFGYAWAPDIPGMYTVIATFMGSESYYPSYAITYMTVAEEPVTPPPSPTPEPLKLPPFDMYILYATIAIIVAIALVGVLLLRKK